MLRFLAIILSGKGHTRNRKTARESYILASDIFRRSDQKILLILGVEYPMELHACSHGRLARKRGVLAAFWISSASLKANARSETHSRSRRETETNSEKVSARLDEREMKWLHRE